MANSSQQSTGRSDVLPANFLCTANKIKRPRLRHLWNCDILPMMTMNATPYRRVDGGEEICLGTWGEQRSGEMIWSPLEVVFFKNGRFLIFITKVCSKVLWWCIYWLRYEHFLPGFQWPVRSLTFLPNLHFPFLSSNSHSLFPWFKHYNPCIWYISQDLP